MRGEREGKQMKSFFVTLRRKLENTRGHNWDELFFFCNIR